MAQIPLSSIFGIRAEKAYNLPDLYAAVEEGCCQWLPKLLEFQTRVRTSCAELRLTLEQELFQAKNKLKTPPPTLSLSTLKQFQVQQRKLVEQRQNDLNLVPRFARLITTRLQQLLISTLGAALQHEIFAVFRRLQDEARTSVHTGHQLHTTLLLGINKSELSKARPLGMLLVEFAITGDHGVDVSPRLEELKTGIYSLLRFPGRIMEAALDSDSAATIPQMPMECRLWVRSTIGKLADTLNLAAGSPPQLTLRYLVEESCVFVQARDCIAALLMDSYSDIATRLSGLQWVEELATFVNTWSEIKLTEISHNEARVFKSLNNLQQWMRRASDVPSVMVSQNGLVRLHGQHLQRDVLPRLKAIRDSIDQELGAFIHHLLQQLERDFETQTSLLKSSANIQRPDVDDYLKVR
jgi:hypothetical protein